MPSSIDPLIVVGGMLMPLFIGDVLRYSRPYSPTPEVIDNRPNYFYVTYMPGGKLPLLESGINTIAEVKAPDGLRRPAILISSSPHKIGSHESPWQDFFDPHNGYIRYYGDNKVPGVDPARARGNKILLEAFEQHSSPDPDVRARATPVIFFERVGREGRQKGFVRFQGFGVVEGVRRVTQYDRKKERSFTNYVFDFAVFSLEGEHEQFDWTWVNRRRDQALSLEQTLEAAPRAWRDWVKTGLIERLRRRVWKLMTVSAQEQRPVYNSSLAEILTQTYEHYRDNKARFEALAAKVTARILRSGGGTWKEGWITQASGDGGADFYGRLDIGSDLPGSGLARVRLIVLGQAKCEKPDTPTSGRHIARTVARLKRGWIGVYVTTSYFSETVQQEVLEDAYPILLVNGRRLAAEVQVMADAANCTVADLLATVDKEYEHLVQNRRPDELLLDT